ncbi:MAG: hypothetical protein LBB52_07165 [Desulfovibrio sp.]|jgi:hypothetical protein|nr:hypothetical protein [Desulfovibrio sp.]
MANEAATRPDLVSGQSRDADDEIVDLLEVIKPGKNVPRSGADDADFTADLDSMLDTLSATEEARTTGIKNLDPNPVGYKVNHNESLDLPDMDDLDNILASLAPDDLRALRQAPESSPEMPLPEVPDFQDLDAIPFAEASETPEDSPPDKEKSVAQAKLAPEKEGERDSLPDSLPGRAEAADSALSAQDGPEVDADGAMIDTEGLEGILGGADAAGAPAPDAPLLSGQGGKENISPGEEHGLENEDMISGEEDGLENEDIALGKEDDSGLEPDPAADVDDRRDKEEQSALERNVQDSPAGTGAGDDDGVKQPVAGEADASQVDAAPYSGPGSRVGEQDRDFAAQAEEAEDRTGGKIAPDGKPLVRNADFGRTSEFDEVDLVELDALLDDMLAGAPASGPGPGETPAVSGSRAEQAAWGGAAQPAKEIRGQAPGADEEQAISPSGADGGQETSGSPPGSADDLRSLRADFEALSDAFDALKVQDRRQDEFANLLKAHGARLDGLDLSREDSEKLLKAHGARLDGLDLSREDSEKLLKAHGARLDGLDLSRDDSEKLLKSYGARLDELELSRATQADDRGGLLNKLEETREELAALGRRFDGIEARLAGLQAGLDKTAAAAAARVIREELAALLAEHA